MEPVNKHILPTLLLQFTLVFIVGCGSPNHKMAEPQSSGTAAADTLSSETLTNLVTLSEPDTQHIDSKIYGDTIRAVIYGKKEGLLITGNFSNGCTHLKNVRYSQSGDTLNVHLEGWQPRDKMCTQALKPFQYIDTSHTAEWLSKFRAHIFPEQ